MKGWLFAIVLVAVALQQEPPVYPDGAFCTPRGTFGNGIQTTDHPCHCKRMDSDPTCEGEPRHDPKCKQACHEDHCACPVICTKPET